MTIAVSALQGAFIEHEKILEKLGVSCIELRQKEDLNNHYDGIILPGGESTVQGKLLRELDMFDTIKAQIKQGLPVLATCAGMILLSENIDNDSTSHFQTIPMTVKRNAYGRQLGSFYTEEDFKGIGKIPMTFIRAPYVESVSDDVEVLATVENHIVAVQYNNQIALSFHPELDPDTRIHEHFISLC
ncbi:MAG: glutamine amidotransferase subunit PdxT [Roseburia sp. 40_7]|nr:MAG: glutamine amidotransferase subunit PdxT [Roseburia sp. 40_7]